MINHYGKEAIKVPGEYMFRLFYTELSTHNKYYIRNRNIQVFFAPMAELVNALVSNTNVFTDLSVRFRLGVRLSKAFKPSGLKAF